MSNPFQKEVERQQRAATGGGNRKSYDLLVEVQGYEEVNGQTAMKAKLLETTKAAQDGYPAEVKILTEKGRDPNPKAAKFDGNVINDDMAKHLTPGMTVIVQGARLSKDSDEVFARRVASMPGQNINKVVEGTFTVSGNEKYGEVWDVQRWPRQATTAEAFFNDQNKAVFDAQVKAHEDFQASREGNGQEPPVKPIMGVAFRAVNENNEVVNYIPPRVKHDKDENYRPLSIDDVKAGYDWYKNEMQKAMGDNVRVEIVPVQQYRVSKLAGESGISAQKSLARGATGTMLKAAGRISPDTDIPRYGNMAVGGPGILQLSPGKAEAVGGEVKLVGAESDWALDLTVSHKKAPVHQLVKDANGNDVTMHESMDADNGIDYKTPDREQKQDAGQSQSQSEDDDASSGPAQSQADAGQDTPDDMNGIEDDLDKAFDNKASAGPTTA